MKRLITLCLLVFLGLNLQAQNLSEYETGSFKKRKDSLNYRILLPENFNAQQKYPVVYFLHGSGERGFDNNSQLIHGGSLFLNASYRKQFPAIVIFPQCPSDDFWANVNWQSSLSQNAKSKFSFIENAKANKTMKLLEAFMKDYQKNKYVDKNRIYIGGLSMGAMGTYELLRRQNKMFAAAIAICGGDNINNVEKYKNIPLWIFHGAKDQVVDPIHSMAIADRMKALSGQVKFTLYANATHNSWTPAFAEKDLFPWLFSQNKAKK